MATAWIILGIVALLLIIMWSIYNGLNKIKKSSQKRMGTNRRSIKEKKRFNTKSYRNSKRIRQTRKRSF
jgi:hypothetical protein